MHVASLVPIPEKETLKTTVSKLVEYVGERVDIDEILKTDIGGRGAVKSKTRNPKL